MLSFFGVLVIVKEHHQIALLLSGDMARIIRPGAGHLIPPVYPLGCKVKLIASLTPFAP